MVSRRKFLRTLAGAGAFCVPTLAAAGSYPFASRNEPIDREGLVRRHDPRLRAIDPLSPLSVGNGEFAFTADVTGLQTIDQVYRTKMPLCTMAQWGWHTATRADGPTEKDLRLVEYDTHGRKVAYHTSAEGQQELYDWLRQNPHRLHLGRVALIDLGGTRDPIMPQDISAIDQRLDLWTGTLHSRFRLHGEQVTVRTAVHPEDDVLAVEIDSTLVANGSLGIALDFPYGSPAMDAADWNQPGKHQTKLRDQSAESARVERRLDRDEYQVATQWEGARAVGEGAHRIVLRPLGRLSRLRFVAAFEPRASRKKAPSATAVFSACSRWWPAFWREGGAIDLGQSRDPRAKELQRRIVLSRYLTAIQCSGSTPPQETGLTVNSWYGKFHLEMHWWHAAHFPLWGRTPSLQRSLGWYRSILPQARELARSQGYQGARWPKMTSPDGRDSPSPIGPLLIWQQPHPIVFAELCYQARPNRATLERYQEVVMATAEFMASFAYFVPAENRYVLGPPVIPAQENHPPRETWNPTFELSYWLYGLKIARQWRQRLGLNRVAEWDGVIERLAPLPVRDGVYLAHENCPQTFTERNRDHPSMLGALGMLPGDGVDPETMRRTLKKVMREWNWDETWGWDFPMTAMTAARLNEPDLAVEALFIDTPKNRYLVNGHNWQRDNLPCYLPGNGGLLYATAMMAGGWRGAPTLHAPGFPPNGEWKVRYEGLDQRVLAAI